ncbi:dTDP-glucose 4,6-dehydratase [Methanosarcina sp. A14]|uniref:dTDP-D-glucose 4,6-dehydratase n=1 Tax=Methanosarcina barkeri MS TaxID=1434108 RepID=A0A0E3QWX7_METBA|nr:MULTISPECIES: DUF3160 domain-containing protein [Methanosarcina]AKB55235.1 hypothetical protein MSBRM_2237 [Methanosarcina barkeri MS]OEC89373.1 dTDP-glucose 4,6-dehydratase [Methanosarcina sp. A14]
MKNLTQTVITLMIFLILLVSIFTGGCLEQSSRLNEKDGTEMIEEVDSDRNTSTGYLKTEAVNLSGFEAENSSLAENYRLDALDIELKSPQYELPLQESDITNYGKFSHKFLTDETALEKLKENGFVVISNPYDSKEDDITAMYNSLENEGQLIFITSDTLLHLYHVQFDDSMSQLEQNKLYDLLWELDKSLLNASVEDYNRASGEEKEAARRNAAYFSVALSLLQPKEEQIKEITDPYGPEAGVYFDPSAKEKYQFEIPEFVKKDVEAELALIEAHQGFELSPIFKYKEDYSQYVPRGHYTHSEILQNYFRAFMWHGRMSMLLKEKLIKSEDPAKDARIQTIQAGLISSQLKDDPDLFKKWDRIYKITAFYVGISDDLGHYEYMEAIESVFGNGSRNFNATTVEKLKVKLAGYRSPEIYGGTGSGAHELILTAEQADQLLEDTKGFRFIGQRFIPDSYLFSRLTGPYTKEYTGNQEHVPFTYTASEYGNNRGFPRGLDAMALMGSERAVYWLGELNDSSYKNYSLRYGELDSEFSNFSAADWNRNLYWSWLYSLQPLLKDYGSGYPTFMQTDAWKDKELSTSLASWTELRHDTILYSKQLYGMDVSLPVFGDKPVGYVEPVPEFYNRLLALTRMTEDGLEELDVLDEDTEGRFESLEIMLERLIEISEKELENEELTEEDKVYISKFGEMILMSASVDEEARKTTLVADVYTEPNDGLVLEEGTGYVDMAIVAYKVPDGRIFLAVGPVMSYYEFKQPIEARLNDEKWREMLEANPPKRSEWGLTYRA